MVGGDIRFDMATEQAKLKELRRRLKEADGNLRKDFLRAMRQAVAPFKADVQRSALSTLPKRGGLAARIAESKFATRNTQTSVSFKMTNTVQLFQLNKGSVRHPVFGNKKNWVFQQVRPGFWDAATNQNINKIRADVVDAIEKFGKELEEGL